MCGRVVQALPPDMIRRLFRVTGGEMFNDARPNWNGAPTQTFMAVREEGGVRSIERMHFGLIPPWSKDRKMAFSTINCRSETVTEKKTFAAPWSDGRRCILPVDLFYEWRGPKGDREALAIARKDRLPLALAAIWGDWQDKAAGERVRSFSIMTCAPNALMAEIHDRMPVILPESAWDRWLAPGPADDLLKPAPAEEMEFWRVSRDVGNVRNNRPDLIEPLAA